MAFLWPCARWEEVLHVQMLLWEEVLHVQMLLGTALGSKIAEWQSGQIDCELGHSP